jgi:hypothetical protein
MKPLINPFEQEAGNLDDILVCRARLQWFGSPEVLVLGIHLHVFVEAYAQWELASDRSSNSRRPVREYVGEVLRATAKVFARWDEGGTMRPRDWEACASALLAASRKHFRPAKPGTYGMREGLRRQSRRLAGSGNAQRIPS